ncbi:MAG TPA: hypothetical protein VKG38_16070 [Solirubrobacteraceae bacterium]|nr:hypothetical protein [Solirubrobacteraceae bacterium]
MRRDPYSILGAQLTAAAARQEERGGSTRARAWRPRRLNAPLIAAIVVLAGGAIAAAATGVLTGSPVSNPAGPPVPHAGYGVPVAGGSDLLALRVADSEGGLPWAMRIVHTTRGLVCVQVGRVYRGQLGQLGVDGVFHDDGRFHRLGSNVLYGTSEEIIQCVLPSQSFSYQDASADRSGDPVPTEGVRPPARELRSILFGLLGPDAASVTYKTSSGLRTEPVSPGTGAYLIVEPVAHAGRQFENGGAIIGPVAQHAVSPPPLDLRLGPRGGTLSAITYRLGSLTCMIGFGAPISTPCPTSRPALPVSRKPAHNLSEPLHLTLVKDTPAVCRAAFLNDPCYRVLLQFKAPYAVTNAASEYTIEARANCPNAPVSSWSIERDIKRGETVKELSVDSFSPSACAATETLQVRYQPAWLAETQPTQRPIIVGTASLRSASR